MIPSMNFEAILFDCDGVLVDSEAITCGVLRDMFEAHGVPVLQGLIADTPEEVEAAV